MIEMNLVYWAEDPKTGRPELRVRPIRFASLELLKKFQEGLAQRRTRNGGRDG